MAYNQLTAQYHARWLRHQHLRLMWDMAKADGLNPAMDPAWSSLAMLCDFER